MSMIRPTPTIAQATDALPVPAEKTRQMHHSLRIFRHRNFQLFFAGQLVSLIGTWMQSTAQQWLVYRITGSQSSLGLVTFLGFLPVLLFSLPFGVLVDRYPKRKILVMTQVLFMLLAAMLTYLTFTGTVQYWHILVLAFFTGIGNALDNPTRQSFFVEIVEREDLTAAVGINSAMFNGARIVGPAISGVLVGALGEAPAFAINALSFLAVISGLLLMKIAPKTQGAARQKGGNEMREGITYIYREKRIFGLMSTVAIFSLIGAPYLVLLPVFARDILQTGPEGYGQLLAAQGVGALLAALILIFREATLHKGRAILFSRVLIGFAITGLALSRTPWLTLLMLVFAGYSYIAQLILSNTLIQHIVPDDLRGRVMSAYSWALGGFYPVGALFIGMVGDGIGAPGAALVIAGGCFLLAIGNLIFFPGLKNIR